MPISVDVIYFIVTIAFKNTAIICCWFIGRIFMFLFLHLDLSYLSCIYMAGMTIQILESLNLINSIHCWTVSELQNKKSAL